ncbi:MAG TPA: TraR/DksA C4-type zinc finger protein [Marinobacter sp.]|nr:TraR/DksA C4-type zinc finger protein [Marinobacter sp.]
MNGRKTELETVKDELEAQLAEVVHALDRIERGLGDICENCGGKIDPRRLQVLPYTTVCVNCPVNVNPSR